MKYEYSVWPDGRLHEKLFFSVYFPTFLLLLEFLILTLGISTPTFPLFPAPHGNLHPLLINTFSWGARIFILLVSLLILDSVRRSRSSTHL